MINYADLFCRVSSKEQELEGYSLPSQEKLLKEYCLQKGFGVGKVFAISESAGGQKQRKLFNEMLKHLEKSNTSVLVVEKTDRLTRNHSDAVEINKWIEKDSNRQVHFVKESFVLHRDSKSNEKLVWNMKVSIAQYYLDNLSEEVKKGQKEKLEQGQLPTRPPLGYRTIGEKGHKIHVPDEKTMHFVLNMFNYYASGNYSIIKLTKQLYSEGLRSINGRRVPKSRIHEYLRNPFYIGINVWNKKQYPATHETFIDRKVFEKVQQMLSGRNTPKYARLEHLFKGYIKCGECAGTITWEEHKGFEYGHCNHYKDCTQEKWVRESEVEQQLLPGFDALQIKNQRLMEWVKKALKTTHKTETEQFSSILEQLNAREQQIKVRLSRLYDDKLDDKVNEEFYNQKFNEYSKERSEIEDQRKRYNTGDKKYYELGSTLYDLAQKAKDIYISADMEKKRKLIRLVFADMKLNEGALTYAYSKPFQLLADAINGTNSSKLSETKRVLEKTFELNSLVDTKGNNDASVVARPLWLPLVDMFCNHKIDLSYVSVPSLEMLVGVNST